ncbi:MAG: protein kinase [Candidatus Competibacteraceae bacterium]|nr:protein kinase [Candidatus Competibacteraceae bacterium]
MTIPASVQFLFEAGIIAPEHLGAVEAAATRVDGLPELAQQLVELNLLTRFQARQVISGKQRGLLLGEYVLMEPIGRGGMGIVFRAVHRRMQRVVAVKQLAPELVKNEDLLKRFQREIQAAAKLVHPHIVTAYDANEDRGIHYYVMEYVPGEPLSEHVRRAGTMDVATAIDAIKEAALGLAYAHSQGVIHRDVKPSNLLLTQEGHVKVLDLGLARSIEERPQESDLTHTGTIMGTVDFMSPEQALNTKRADHRADIYSLGCTLFYLLTKREVYQGETMMERVVAHREAPIPSLRDFREDIPEEVDQFFQKMIAKSSEQRFQTMTEVVSACEKLFVAETDTTLDFTFHEPQKPLEATLCKTRIDPAQIPRRSKTYGGRIIASSCLCLCLVLTIWGSMSPRNESENDAVSETAYGLGGLWTWRFAPRTASFLGTGWEWDELADDQKNDYWVSVFGLARVFSPDTGGLISYRYYRNDAEPADQGFRENRLNIRFSMKF